MLAGCSESGSVPEIQAAADCDASVVYRDAEYLCHIRYVDRNTASVTLLSPEGVSGLTFTRGGGEYSCSLGALLCRNTAAEEGSLYDEVFGVFDILAETAPDSVRRAADDRFEFTYDGMTLTADGSGRPLSTKNGNITIKMAAPS